MNKPFYDKELGRVTSGFAILQPRVSTTITGAFKSRYAYINSGHASLDPYSKYVSNVYQDMFEEGSFFGKGLIHVDQFLEIGRNAFPENRILSHDLLEGCYIRTALVSDVELLEEYP
jgi:cyclic beta-1,2-glucan synthetase